MSLRITYKLYEAEVEEFQQFCDAIRGVGTDQYTPMSREEIARQALFYAISDARRKAREMREKQVVSGSSPISQKVLDDAANRVGIPSGDMVETSDAGTGSGSPTLADEEAVSAPTT